MAEALEDGWQAGDARRTTRCVHGYVVGFADLLREMGAALGARVLEDDDVVALDVGVDFFYANGAVLRRPVRDADLPGVARPAAPLLRGRPRRELDAAVGLADPAARAAWA